MHIQQELDEELNNLFDTIRKNQVFDHQLRLKKTLL